MQLTDMDCSKSISEIVRKDYRTAEVFKKYGINYCCGGQLSLEEACSLKNLDQTVLQNDLQKAIQGVSLPHTLQFDNWRMDFLIDYVVNVYHGYLQQTLVALEANLISFIEGHKKKHSELIDILSTFKELSSVLINHTKQEAEITFPYIRQIESTYRRKEVYASLFIRTMRKPLTLILENEHKQISELLIQLREKANHYQFPTNACTNHQVIYHQLQELDQHLVQLQHLENNILYPKAIAMEQELLQ